MDQAFITMWEKWIKRLKFDSRAADGVRHAERNDAIVSQPKRKLKKVENPGGPPPGSRTPRLF